jgi:cation diffusion facilitator CzcD-associated flavoprotein CzcO
MTVEDTNIDTLIVGGGQAGIAMSEHLTTLGISHLVIEKTASLKPGEPGVGTRWWRMVRRGTTVSRGWNLKGESRQLHSQRRCGGIL